MKSLIERSFDITVLSEQRRKKTRFVIITIACILVCAAIFYLGFRWFLDRQYDSYQVEHSVYVKNGNSLLYEAYHDGIIRYGRDGVTAVDRKGNSIWSGSYEMANPRIDICGSSVVLADIGGDSLYVYRGEGTGTGFTVDYPIVQACISKQGVIAVLMEESSSNTIALYNPFNKAETLLAEIPTNVEDGYPVSFDLSPDGSSVVASYLNVTTGAAQSHVAFYNFTEVGKNANCLVGAHNYKESLISEVQFMGNSDVCLFGEKGFYLWTNMKQPESVTEKEFEETIQSAFIDESHVGVLLKKDDARNIMKLYDKRGNNTLTTEVDAAFTHVQIRGDEILFNSAERCAIYRTNGIRKFSKDLKSTISYFFPTERMNYYFFVQDSKIKIIKLK